MSSPHPGCAVLPADTSASPSSGTRRLAGEGLDIEFVRLARGESLLRAVGPWAGEEVATVLEGILLVESGDERHQLTTGEGIIIPPGQGSRWSAQDGPGLLYRVIVRTIADSSP